MESDTIYRQEATSCGKSTCRRCQEGRGHGPYWFAYRIENGRLVRTYIGKRLAGTRSPGVVQTPPPLFRLVTLGSFSLVRSGGQRQAQAETAALRQHARARALLRYLISGPGRMRVRDQVIDALWPNSQSETASALLDRSLHELRQLLEPTHDARQPWQIVRLEHDVLSLADQATLWIDADAFDERLAQAHATDDPSKTERLLEQAIGLYGGEYLQEVRDAEWAVARREILCRKWLGALMESADLRVIRGDLVGAIAWLDRLLAADATNEGAAKRLIAVLAQLQRRAEALRFYQQFTIAFQRAHGTDPPLEMRTLHEEIRRGEPVAIPTTPRPSFRRLRVEQG
jgi:DNA-binding SARP family transcriptional activator